MARGMSKQVLEAVARRWRRMAAQDGSVHLTGATWIVTAKAG